MQECEADKLIADEENDDVEWNLKEKEETSLLKAHGGGKAPTKNSLERWPDFRRRSGCLAGCCAAAGLAALLTLLVLISAQSTNVQAYRPTERLDYVLDPNWNFDENPRRRQYEWVIEDTELNPDGVFRDMIVINGAFPGPLIECNEGDTLVVHVRNERKNSTSIHWHGLFQNGTNWMDGTVGVTNCPIGPGKQFTYEFQVTGQSGTYYYHAHMGMQDSDGIYGPLIIRSKQERQLQKLPYETDRVIMVQDYYYNSSATLIMEYLQSDRENVEPVPDGALINGQNVRDCDSLKDRKCDNSTSLRPVFHLAHNQNHRLRFINTGALAEFQIQIDEHEFAVIEADGTDTLPVYYHRLNISPGQRYSIVLTPKTTGTKSIWMRAKMVTNCFRAANSNLDPEIRGIIEFDPPSSNVLNSHELLPKSKDWPDVVEVICKDMNTSELVPSHKMPAPSKADKFFYIRANFEIGAWRLSRGFFNQSSWRPNVRSPTLHRVFDGLQSANESFIQSNRSDVAFVNDKAFETEREFVIQTRGTQVLDLLIQNFDDGNHPLHLHGYKYFVLAHGHGGFDPDVVYPSLDLSNPLRRDTASLEGYGWLLIRLVADNPGAWALHCHISWHTEAGLLMQLLTRTDAMKAWDIPAKNRLLCEAPFLDRGMAPKDEVFFTDD